MDNDLFTIFFYASAFAFSALLGGWIVMVAATSPYPIVKRTKREKTFKNPSTGETEQFPSYYDRPTLDLSVVIPAYNEEIRLIPMLDECIEYLEERVKSGLTYEIIVVSDGSTDKTVAVAEKYCKKFGTNKFRILDLEFNRGKGGAVRLGMQSGRGSLLLFVDADGATKFSDLTKIEQKLFDLIAAKTHTDCNNKAAISIGSRAHMQDEAVATRSFFRTVLMYGFHFLVWLLTVRTIKDTQCGFKLFTRKAAQVSFDSLHVERWAFDVEVLYIAEKLKIPIAEVAVNWTEIDGSKVTPIWSWIQMGFDLCYIWIKYATMAWRIKSDRFM